MKITWRFLLVVVSITVFAFAVVFEQQASPASLPVFVDTAGFVRWSLTGLAVWLGGLGVLVLAGQALSHLTMQNVFRDIQASQFTMSTSERAIRLVYQIVIALASLYFYLSIPILIAGMVVLSGGIILWLESFQLRSRRVYLSLFLGVLVVVGGLVASLFRRVRHADPSRRVGMEEMPLLWQTIREVAQLLHTAPVHHIFLTYGVDVAVMERGSLLTRLRGKGQRTLILGLGGLYGMTRGQLRAILAHEYGHFDNKDTPGGRLASQVSLSIHWMSENLAGRGLLTWLNPVWWFTIGYYRLFKGITLASSRLSEILADRQAALACGSLCLSSAILHLMRRDLEFVLQLDGEVNRAHAAQEGLNNLYHLPPLSSSEVREVERTLAELLHCPSSPSDSHPAPNDRFALIRLVQGPNPAADDPRPALELLSGAAPAALEQLELQLTANFEKSLVRQGVLKPGRG